MPTSKHEGLIELFRDRPPLAAELVEILGIKLPAWRQARVDSGELPDLVPTQRLADVVGRHLEELMAIGTYEYQSDFARRYFGRGKAEGMAEGKVEGEAEALLEVLAARGIAVPDDVRARITGCTDLEQLRTWIRRAVTAESVDDLFG